MDLPGCYSLDAHSAEEEVARDFLRSGEADCAVVVCDATCLERNLNLALQVLEVTPKTVVCVNLLDEAKRKGIRVDLERLSSLLGVPVVGASARAGKGLQELMAQVERVSALPSNPLAPAANQEGEETAAIRRVRRAESLARAVTASGSGGYSPRDKKLDRILTSPLTGFPIMLLMLLGIFWLTIAGANYPSQLLSAGLFWLGDRLAEGLASLHVADWLIGLLCDGVYRTLAWVVAVMLPPMAIFFPLFTLLEDLGYLPRVAFNMDRCFKCCGACGKQALTTCMGDMSLQTLLGCAVGIGFWRAQNSIEGHEDDIAFGDLEPFLKKRF